MRLLANSVHHRAPLWDHIDRIGLNADTAFAYIAEETFALVERDKAAAEKKAKAQRKGR